MIDSLYQFVTKLGFPDPLHAPITHIPIGLVIGAFLFLVVGLVFARTNVLTTARHVSILAFLFVFPTILFGVFDWLHFFKGALIPPIKMKMILASALLPGPGFRRIVPQAVLRGLLRRGASRLCVRCQGQQIGSDQAEEGCSRGRVVHVLALLLLRLR
ncbi:MAG TPA: hypothetical protein VFB30_02425, partial [Spirochaetia bacterium]|nr:hypothetical protein [Spirochaetia bacterium]